MVMKMCNDCFFNKDCPHKEIFLGIILKEYNGSLDNPYTEACCRFKARHSKGNKKPKSSGKLKLKQKYICFED